MRSLVPPRRRKRLVPNAAFSFFFLACPALAFDLSPRTGSPGQTLVVKVTTAPVPAQGATVTFSPPGLTASNLQNDAAGFLTFTLTISSEARPGTYSSLYTRGAVTIPNPAAFTVFSLATPTPTRAPTAPPTPVPTEPPTQPPTQPPSAPPGEPTSPPEATPARPEGPPTRVAPPPPPGWVQVPLPPDPVAPPVPPPPKTKEKKKTPPRTEEKTTPPPQETPPPLPQTPPSQGEDKPPTIYGEEFQGLPLDIHPIQVVQDPFHEALNEDIVLVQEKKTMVRVFPQLPKGRDRIDNVKCCLSWNGEQEQCITATLIRHKGRIWVLPDTIFAPSTPGDASEGERIIGWMGNPARAKFLDNLQDKYWAYNFTYGNGRPAPVNNLVLDARLEINGATVAKSKEQTPKDFKLKPFLWNNGANFNVVVTAYTAKGKLKDFPNAQVGVAFPALAKHALKYLGQILAVYPIPENKISLTLGLQLDPADPLKVVLEGGSDIDWFAGPWSHTATLEKRYPNADTILVVSPDNFRVGQLPIVNTGNREGHTPANSDRVHYIEEKSTGTDSLVAAHETGHDSRFFGAPHPACQTVEDAWDAGAHLGVSATKRGRCQLMSQAQEGKPETLTVWISPTEYRRLVGLMVKGGNDPLLVALMGRIDRSGRVEVSEPRLLMGEQPVSQAGDGRLFFEGLGGKRLGHWTFPLREEPRDPNFRGFNVRSPLPEGSRKMTLTLPGGFRREYRISAEAPTIDWKSVRVEKDGTELRLRLAMTHPGGERVTPHFFYSRDGTNFSDVSYLSGDASTGEYLLPIAHLPGGPHAKLCVWAEAGLRLTESCSPVFAVPDRKPVVFLKENSEAGLANRFEALVFDPENPLDVKIEWSADGRISLGSGETPETKLLKQLRPGLHRLEVRVRDSAGQETVAGALLRLP